MNRRKQDETPDIRQQLGDQLKCLDMRLDTSLGLLSELQDFYRRRAEMELEHSKNLDRLVKQIMMRHKTEKQKREFWPGYSTYTCWQYLLSSTKRASRDHATIADIYNTQMTQRFSDLGEDIQRIYKKCRETGGAAHEEILKVLNELQSAMKTYHLYHGESKQAEGKLKEAETAKSKIELTPKGTLSKKFRNYEKQIEKRQHKYSESKLKALKARNEYLLSLDSTNASIHKYFVEDLHNLIDCMDHGYHNTVQRALMTHMSAEENYIHARQDCMQLLHKSINDLDQRADKQKFLELYHQSFALPKKFEFQAHKGDEVRQISAQKQVQDELLERLNQLNDRLHKVKVENDEVWKTLETAEGSLMEMLNQKDYDVSSLFCEENKPPKSPHEHYKKRSDRLETEAFYLDKFQNYLVGNNLIARLQAKATAINKALGEGAADGDSLSGTLTRPPSLPPKPKKQRRIGKAPLVGQPKLFGGSIEEYVEASNQEIPLVVKSCIRVINLYGMHHQGVFRVSGSLHEINEFKNAFEKGEDPLFATQDGRDINSIAGVLKMYFRELREPLFPTQYFDEFMSYSQLESASECISKVKELIASLPRAIFVVMRYLFAFLNHLSEYSDENMMDPYNLAICFGPTLLPIPPNRDQVQFQGNVIELMRNIIIHHEELFPNDGSGVTYERIIDDDVDAGDSLDNLSDEEQELEDNTSEDASSQWMLPWKRSVQEVEEKEAIAQYDFTGRTDRELTFKKGDHLKVFHQVSSDWWEGTVDGKEGLVPDKYIIIGARDSDSEFARFCLLRELDDRSLNEEDKRRSTESLPAKPFTLAPLTDDDKSASQPNIAMPLPTSSTVPPSRPPRLSTTSTDSGKSNASSSTAGSSSSGGSSDSPTGSLHSFASKDSAYSMSSKETLDDLDEEEEEESLDEEKIMNNSPPQTILPVTTHTVMVARISPTEVKTTEDLHNDIDSALAEVMSGLQSLEKQQSFDKPPTSSSTLPSTNKTSINIAAKHTPDLVLDLPVSDEPPSPKEQASPVVTSSSSGSDTESPTLSTAEVFAKSNQSTIKKGTTLTMSKAGGATRVAELSGSSSMRVHASKNAAAAVASVSTGVTEEPQTSNVAEQVWQPQQASILRPGDRPVTPERARTMHERTPEKPILPNKPHTLPRPSPERPANKPAPPPLKAKPSVSRKPGRSPEVLQKLRDGTLGSMDSSNA